MAKKPTPGTSPSSPDELPEGRYSDRELSWLAFNERVLDLARDTERIPLLERAKFLAIFSSNLDEFFMVRVAGLKRRIDAGVAVPSVAGMLPRELHDAILARTHDLVSEQSRVFAEEVRPGLVDEGIEILRWAELSDDEKGRMRTLFSERIFPILTPLAVDPSTPSRTFAAYRSTWPLCWRIPLLAQSSSLGSKCRRCCLGWSTWARDDSFR